VTDKRAASLRRSRPLRWGLFWLVVIALIVVPFVVWEEPLALAFTAALDRLRAEPVWSGALIIVLLGADPVLPIPSSLISAFAGAAFHWALAASLIWAGMTLGCLVGYGLGASAGRGLGRILVGEDELSRARRLFARVGPAALAGARAVPVLAEASVLAAGAVRMPLAPFLVSTALANLAVALAYAGAGAAAMQAGSFLLIVFGLCLVPALGFGLWRLLGLGKQKSD